MILGSVSEADLRDTLTRTVMLDRWEAESVAMQLQPESVRILEDDFQTIKIQLFALGLIRRDETQTELKWCLTPHGQTKLMRISALRSEHKVVPSSHSNLQT